MRKEQPMMKRLRSRKQNEDRATAKAVILFTFIIMVVTVAKTIAEVI
jgi:hypothetical protein